MLIHTLYHSQNQMIPVSSKNYGCIAVRHVWLEITNIQVPPMAFLQLFLSDKCLFTEAVYHMEGIDEKQYVHSCTHMEWIDYFHGNVVLILLNIEMTVWFWNHWNKKKYQCIIFALILLWTLNIWFQDMSQITFILESKINCTHVQKWKY